MVSIDELIEEIRRDNRSGAAELTRRAVQVLSLLVNSEKSKDAAWLRNEIRRVSRALAAAQPSMASIINLANQIFIISARSNRAKTIRSDIKRQLKETLARQGRSVQRIARNFLKVIDGRNQVVTYSYSSTVIRALIYAHKRGEKFKVVCSEARPICEGVRAAERLADAGIDVILVTDAALLGFIPQADMVAVGADCVTDSWLVNKVGTYALALIARSNRVPFYCLASEDKLLAPELYALYKNPPRDHREILARKPKNVQVLNYYFEATPLKLLSALITENGVLAVKDVRRRIRGFQAALAKASSSP